MWRAVKFGRRVRLAFNLGLTLEAPYRVFLRSHQLSTEAATQLSLYLLSSCDLRLSVVVGRLRVNSR
jgi:hypothetical protein